MPTQLTAEQVINSLLSADAGLKALVGVNIFQDVAHEGDEQNWVTFFRVSNNRVTSMDGFDGLSEFRYQINCWSGDSTKRNLMRDAILSIFSESLVPTVQGTEVHFQHVNDQNEFEEGPPKRFGSRLDFMVWI